MLIVHSFLDPSLMYSQQHGAIIEGKCGGHCGRCMPDKGLFLDLAPSEKSFVDSEEELWR